VENPRSTAGLLRAAQAGDREAAQALFVAFYPRVLRIAEIRLGRRLRRLFDAADIAQSVFGRAYRSLPGFKDEGPGSFLSWLDAIVEHTVRDKARWFEADRRGGSRREVGPLTGKESAPSSASPSRLAERAETIERFHRAMKTLTPRERATVEVRKFLGLRGAEAAHALGVSEESMRQNYARAVEKLGRVLRATP
jgi:RNA polymerase sigma-70 factor (ECF subfamily)